MFCLHVKQPLPPRDNPIAVNNNNNNNSYYYYYYYYSIEANYSLDVSDQVSHPYNETGKFVVLYILSLRRYTGGETGSK